MATTDLGTLKLDLLMRVHGSDDDPTEVGTIEVPVRAVPHGHVPDFSALDQAAHEIAHALNADE